MCMPNMFKNVYETSMTGIFVKRFVFCLKLFVALKLV